MINMYDAPMFTQGYTQTFSEIYSNEEDFLLDYNNIGIAPTITDASAKDLFYLLYAKYGNSRIANADVTQFKYKLFSIVYMYGPSWETRKKLQKQIRELTAEELATGNSTVNNIALNPDEGPSTASLDALPMISQQNRSNQKRGKLEAISAQYNQIITDVTEEFLGEFKKLFRKHVGLTEIIYINY